MSTYLYRRRRRLTVFNLFTVLLRFGTARLRLRRTTLVPGRRLILFNFLPPISSFFVRLLRRLTFVVPELVRTDEIGIKSSGISVFPISSFSFPGVM